MGMKSSSASTASPQSPRSPGSGGAAQPQLKQQRCDKCDGAHDTVRCPHYKRPRDRHPDAQRSAGLKLGSDAGPLRLRHCRVVRQPGDGSCLYHSLRYGLQQLRAGDVPSTSALRQRLARWVALNAQLRIADTPVAMWVKWDSGLSPEAYANRMSRYGWGGGIEMAACSRLMGVNVWVYERSKGGYERISCFDAPKAQNPNASTVHILYCGGVHYDALIPDPAELVAAIKNAPKLWPPSSQSPNPVYNNSACSSFRSGKDARGLYRGGDKGAYARGMSTPHSHARKGRASIHTYGSNAHKKHQRRRSF